MLRQPFFKRKRKEGKIPLTEAGPPSQPLARVHQTLLSPTLVRPGDRLHHYAHSKSRLPGGRWEEWKVSEQSNNTGNWGTEFFIETLVFFCSRSSSTELMVIVLQLLSSQFVVIALQLLSSQWPTNICINGEFSSGYLHLNKGTAMLPILTCSMSHNFWTLFFSYIWYSSVYSKLCPSFYFSLSFGSGQLQFIKYYISRKLFFFSFSKF